MNVSRKFGTSPKVFLYGNYPHLYIWYVAIHVCILRPTYGIHSHTISIESLIFGLPIIYLLRHNLG